MAEDLFDFAGPDCRTELDPVYEQMVQYARDLRKLLDSRDADDKKRGSRNGPAPGSPGTAARPIDAPQIIGQSPTILESLQLCQRVAPTLTTVLLLGPTGTGKELAATLIHYHSPRRQGPLIAVNCAALPDSLAESELFGHERGAFTNATDRRCGQFELAAGGTIFLDEVGELSLAIQAKLLRILEQREFRRVGGVEILPLDVRVVAATNRDLEEEVAAGRFRRDLFYRLNVFPVHLPALADRPEDIPLLTRFFVEQLSRKIDPDADPPAVTEAAMAHLQAYTWPGNVRELRNVVERCLVLAGGGTIEVEHLPDPIRHAGAVVAITQASRLAQQEASMVLKALEDSNWNKAEAARRLGISWDNLRYRIKKYNLKEGKSE